MADDVSLSSNAPTFSVRGTLLSVNALRDIHSKLINVRRDDENKKSTLHDVLELIDHVDCSAVVTKNKSLETLNSSDTKDLSVDVCRLLYDCAKVKVFTGKEDVGYVASDFHRVADVAMIGMQCFYALLTKETFNGNGSLDEVMDYLVFYAFLLCIEHIDEALWTSANSVSLAQDLLQKIIDVRCASVEELLCGSDKKRSLFGRVLSFHLPHFTRANWKQNPSVKCVLRWCLLHVKFPQLSDYLDQVLPHCLLLVDDHEVTNQIMGVKCLDHIVENVSKTELSWFGRADVIYDSLQKLTFSHESDLVDVLHQCMLKILAVIEMKSKLSDTKGRTSSYDEMFHRLLHQMEVETMIDTRRTHSRYLSSYVSALGIHAVKHFDKLFQVVFSYLEVYDGPHELTRINVLDGLRTTILICWPRIPYRCEQIIKALIKLIYETVSDRTVTPDSVKSHMIQQAVDCLVLVKRLCPERTLAALNAVKDVGLGPECTKHIDEILATE